MFPLLLLVVISVAAIEEGYKNYTGYQIIQLAPTTEEHLQFIGNLDTELGFDLDVLRAVNRIGSHSEVLVPPERIRPVLQSLNQNGVPHEIAVPDVGAILSRERRQFTSTVPGQFDVFSYHSYDEQMRYIEGVAAKRFSFVQQGIMGYSFERRPIKYLKIGWPSPVAKPVLLIDAGVHAREWISHATAIYAIQRLTTDPSFESLLRIIDIYVIPNANPDGYEYSRNRDRLWRKTRTGPRGVNRCYGVDLNRNFPFFFGFDGTSNDPCSEIYLGERALTEVEAGALSRFLLAHRSSIRGYLTLHSYGGNILFPWGYKKHTYPGDVKDLLWAGNRISAAIARSRGVVYKVGNSADALYAAAGASDDYAKSIGIKYVFTLELRPTEQEALAARGFELPASEIRPTVIEAFDGIMEMATIIRNQRVSSLRPRRPSPPLRRPSSPRLPPRPVPRPRPVAPSTPRRPTSKRSPPPLTSSSGRI